MATSDREDSLESWKCIARELADDYVQSCVLFSSNESGNGRQNTEYDN